MSANVVLVAHAADRLGNLILLVFGNGVQLGEAVEVSPDRREADLPERLRVAGSPNRHSATLPLTSTSPGG
jgi:hypothetical protein